ncbi:MAG: response regulator transcription factor [Oscillospiraceae bacterium]
MARILVIDDDIAICKMVEKALVRDGHSVKTINTVLEVTANDLKLANLILLDIMMPQIDGITFCKQNRGTIDCPILFLTAKAMEEDVVDGFVAGGDDYIKKPFSISELRARVNAHLRREGREKHQNLVLGDFAFDLSEKVLAFKGGSISLTKSEYEICELLARRKGQVFSLEQILENIFGFNSDSDTSSIRVHIKNIRSKCDVPIETVWGVGYKWK